MPDAPHPSDSPRRNGTLASHASACVAAGLCALPAIRRGEEKRVALSSWKPYQTRLPSGENCGFDNDCWPSAMTRSAPSAPTSTRS